MGREMRINERGTVFVIALLMLLLLTLIAISSLSTTTFEANISGNERVGTDAFYVSEAGVQVAISKVPDTAPIPKTLLKDDSYYWSGGPNDKESPKSFDNLGLYHMAGYDSSWSFKRFRANTSGESFGAVKEVEVQISYGPFGHGTTY